MILKMSILPKILDTVISYKTIIINDSYLIESFFNKHYTERVNEMTQWENNPFTNERQIVITSAIICSIDTCLSENDS